MNPGKMIYIRIALAVTGSGLLMSVFFIFRPKIQPRMTAISLLPPAKKLGIQGELTPEKIAALVSESKLQPISDSKSPVKEPELPSGINPPADADALGFGQSKFLVDSRWATVRFIGEDPAGAGLTGAELNIAQLQGLGTVSDTVPITTTVQTINEMMENYFVPLINSIPRADDILSKIKIQGAYFAPRTKNFDGSEPERDNAYVVGLQSLYLYPSSCFDKTTANACNPLGYSAGHDPTIIAHELSHVIFNQIRDGQSLEGWQWFAVNEGYADYFSASYFGDPTIGRIWRVSRPSGSRYLRRLLDTPTTDDPKALEEGHAFGSVWSSALWRIRNQLISKYKIKPSDFDRIVLMSINFLGESSKTRLGDAAAAVLKAADVFGHPDWKSLMIEEFKKSEVELARGQKILVATGETIETQQGGLSCGQVSTVRTSSHPSVTSWNLTALMLLPLVLFRKKRKTVVLQRLFLLLLLTVMQGCMLSSLWKSPETKPGGMAIIYKCNLSTLNDGTPLMPADRSVSFIFPDSVAAESQTEQIFVGDDRFENASSSLLLIVDKSNMRIDQFRRRDGSLYQVNLNQKYLNSEDAIAVQNMRLATILIEGAGRAWKKEMSQAPVGTGAIQPARTAVSFDVTGTPATATIRADILGARGFGPLANEISINGNMLCAYQKTTR
jgi:hypothetical protein